MNDSVKAIESFNKAEANGYESAQMYMLMATLFLQEGDETQAIRNINRAILKNISQRKINDLNARIEQLNREIAAAEAAEAEAARRAAEAAAAAARAKAS